MKFDIKYIIKDKKARLISLGILLFLIIVAATWFFMSGPRDSAEVDLVAPLGADGRVLPAPDFLSEEEKDGFGLPAEAKVQSLKRDENGQVMVYKIIRSDSDIILDPAGIAPISPRQKK